MDPHRNDHERQHPRPEAFQGAVRGEDPGRWEAHGPDARPVGWGHASAGGSPDTTVGTAGTSTAPPATPAPRTETVVTERERYPEPALEAEPPVDRPRFSLGATFLGWSVAAFFTMVFSAVAITATGGAVVEDGVVALGTLALASFVGYLVAAFLANLIGGYAAGRISLWNGVWHGLGIVAWAVLFAILGVVAGVYAADALGFGVTIDLTAIDGTSVVAILLALAVMLAGAALGGRLGERYHGDARDAAWRRRETRHRGRPL